jgi:trehalose 6-phosphate phosphatase
MTDSWAGQGHPPPHALLTGASLFLDFDGTLVELAGRPDDVRVDANLTDIVGRLAERLEGRLAIVTGRPAQQARELLAAEVVVVGSHGQEFLGKDGSKASPPRPASLGEVLVAMQELASRRPGLIVEDKPLGVALHYRQSPGAAAECDALASELATRHALHLQAGKMMIEVRAAGGNKGTAIRMLMQEPNMSGTRPVFMGDDLTDEPGFVAVAELGGAGVLIGEPRETAARYRLDGVEAALGWLKAASAQAA